MLDIKESKNNENIVGTENEFQQLELPKEILKALESLNYLQPTPVQKKCLPIMLAEQDLIAQAQTGTGKTAAFALPILSKISLEIKSPQALIIAPTRELAIQVGDAFKSYAKHLPGFHLTPIFGGQDYTVQLRSLKRGPQVIVGTPGRLMDQLKRKNLSLKNIKTIVIDEADEMLKMGFLEDITWILEQIKTPHQTALFSATMPKPIQKIAERYLKNPHKIHLRTTKQNAPTIEQQYMNVNQRQKLEALNRLLQVEEMQAAILFVRTKSASAELAEKLQSRGYSAAALNGDMSQSLREKVIARLRKGSLNIVIATDVAARGIDVERVSHVLNYDMPHDVESYIHRIGRTGRAGRSGKAILFVTPKEQSRLREIERSTGKEIAKINPPSRDEISKKRTENLQKKIIDISEKSKKLLSYEKMVEEIIKNSNHDPIKIAASLAYLLEQNDPIPEYDLTIEPEKNRSSNRKRPNRNSRRPGGFSKKASGNKAPRRKSSNNKGDFKKGAFKKSKNKHREKSYS